MSLVSLVLDPREQVQQESVFESKPQQSKDMLAEVTSFASLMMILLLIVM